MMIRISYLFLLCVPLCVPLWISGCSMVDKANVSPSHPPLITQTTEAEPSRVLWSNTFDGIRWRSPWHLDQIGTWGLDNCQIVQLSDGPFERVLRVRYPAGSASPGVSDRHGIAIGGAGFRATLGLTPQEQLRLSYYVRFADDFEFVKGGKLPGLYGGIANSGGNIPDGTNGFSTRFMWRQQGKGEVYAYLPTSEQYGTSLGSGHWQFQPGQWHHLVQEVTLNHPRQADGRIRVWVDEQLVLDQSNLVFRSTDALKIDGIFFSTFFGGGDLSWSTPKETYADFAHFSVTEPF